MITSFEQYKHYIGERLIESQRELSALSKPEYFLSEIHKPEFGKAILNTNYFTPKEKEAIKEYEWNKFFETNEGISDTFNKLKSSIVDKLEKLWKNITSFAEKVKTWISDIINEQLKQIKHEAIQTAKTTYKKVVSTKHHFNKLLLKEEGDWYKSFFNFLVVEVLGLFQNLLHNALISSTKESLIQGIDTYGSDYLSLITEGTSISGAYNFLLSKIKNTKAYEAISHLLKVTKECVSVLDNMIAGAASKTLMLFANKAKSISPKAPNPPQSKFEASGIIINVATQSSLELTIGVSAWTVGWKKLALKLTSSLLSHGIPGYYIIYYALKGAKYMLCIEHTIHLLHSV